MGKWSLIENLETKLLDIFESSLDAHVRRYVL